MAGRFINPLPQFSDSTPTMYAGAKLFFYATGTSTKLNTYTTKALSVANPNPIVLNSAGRLPNDIFLQDLEYKVVLAPSTDSDPPSSPIWTADPVSHRDSALVAKTLTGSGSPAGVVAGTAGSASILPDFYWDYTNSILYVCTTTGVAAAAVWTAVNASTAAAVIPPPQGYLTATSATPIIPSDVTAATAIYYTPYVGNLVPIYNGSSFTPTVFTELTLTLVSSHAANNIYDVFIFNNSGVPTIVTGPSWSAGTSGSITAGSCARGTGAGGTALSRINGINTNAVQIAARNGSTTYTVNANLATYIGSIFMDGTNGQISCHRSSGQSRKWSIWNAYNRNRIALLASDSTATWTTAPTTWRQSRADATNTATGFCGLAEETIIADFAQYIVQTASSATALANIGIGINSTTSPSGMEGSVRTVFTATAGGGGGIAKASASLAPALGINNFNMIEQAPSNTSNNSFAGGVDMRMVVQWSA